MKDCYLAPDTSLHCAWLQDFMVVHLCEPCSVCRRHVTGGSLHRYHPPPNGMPQLKPPPERKFEGIRLEAPGAGPSPSGPLAHFQVSDNEPPLHKTDAATPALNMQLHAVSAADSRSRCIIL